jgi:hypothetical protein
MKKVTMMMTVLVYMVVGYMTHPNLTSPMSGGRREAMKQHAPHVGYVGRDLNMIDHSRSRSRTRVPTVVSS